MTQPLPDDFTFPTPLALFLDFDGTLAPFQDDPNAVHLSQEQFALVKKIGETLNGALALISGRDIRDLSKRAPDTVWRLGNHGLFSAAPGESAPQTLIDISDDIRKEVADIVAGYDGVRLEHKGPVLAIHHRAAPEAGPDLVAALPDLPEDHAVQVGKNVIEIKPVDANKGRALLRQMKTDTFSGRIPVMIGDDTTDEDGFMAATQLGGFGIKMGMGETTARYRIDTIPDLYRLLETRL